jgi:hypothetical protein
LYLSFIRKINKVNINRLALLRGKLSVFPATHNGMQMSESDSPASTASKPQRADPESSQNVPETEMIASAAKGPRAEKPRKICVCLDGSAESKAVLNAMTIDLP